MAGYDFFGYEQNFNNFYQDNPEFDLFDGGSKELAADIELFPLHSLSTILNLRKQYPK